MNKLKSQKYLETQYITDSVACSNAQNIYFFLSFYPFLPRLVIVLGQCPHFFVCPWKL